MSILCEKCNEPLFSETDVMGETTCVGFFSPPGHDHDDNCEKRAASCVNGHRISVSIRRRCPVEGCDWVGKLNCSICHPGTQKVDEWPPVREKDALEELADLGDSLDDEGPEGGGSIRG